MALVKPVVLEWNGVRLEPLAFEHEAGLRQAVSDGELWRLRVTSAPDPLQTLAYIERAIEMREEESRFPFAVKDAVTHQIIGTTSYHDIIANIRRVEIGWTWYAKRYQRTHVNTTSKYLLLRHAFEVMDCSVVGFRTDIENLRSQQAIERLGAKRDGVIRRHALRRDGTIRDTVMYSIISEEWMTVKERLEVLLAR